MSTASQTRASTGNPKENPTPRSRQAFANLWVAPAESQRTTAAGAPSAPGAGRGSEGVAFAQQPGQGFTAGDLGGDSSVNR